MAYRDDRHALEARRDELRRALDEAAGVADALRGAEDRQAALAAELAAVEARIAHPGARRRRLVVGVGVGLGLFSLLGLGVLVVGGPHRLAARFQDQLECRGTDRPAPEKHAEGLVFEQAVRACFNADGVRVYADHRVEVLDGRLEHLYSSRTVMSPEADRLIALTQSLQPYSVVHQCGTTHVETTLYGAGWLPASDARRAELERLGWEVLQQAQGGREKEPDL